MTEKWEYKLHRGKPWQGLLVFGAGGGKGDFKLEKAINQFGLEGWEAVGIHVQSNGNWILFKRRLP